MAKLQYRLILNQQKRWETGQGARSYTLGLGPNCICVHWEVTVWVAVGWKGTGVLMGAVLSMSQHHKAIWISEAVCWGCLRKIVAYGWKAMMRFHLKCWVWAGWVFFVTSALFKSDLGKPETVQQRGMQRWSGEVEEVVLIWSDKEKTVMLW